MNHTAFLLIIGKLGDVAETETGVDRFLFSVGLGFCSTTFESS